MWPPIVIQPMFYLLWTVLACSVIPRKSEGWVYSETRVCLQAEGEHGDTDEEDGYHLYHLWRKIICFDT